MEKGKLSYRKMISFYNKVINNLKRYARILDENDWNSRKSIIRALLSISFGILLLSPGYFLARSTVEIAEVAIFSIMILYPLLGIYLTLKKDILFSLLITNLGAVACITALAFFTGGLGSFVLSWYLAILTMLGGFSNQNALRITTLAIVASLLILLVLELVNAVPGFPVPEREVRILSLLFITSVSVMLGLSLLGSIRTRTKNRKELKKARDTAEEQKLIAEGASKAKSEFLATMSHELRTPMNGVIGMSILLLEHTDLSDQQKRYANTIKQSGDALLYLIDDILDYSSLENDCIELDESEFSIRELIETIFEIHSHAAYKAGIEISYHLPQRMFKAYKGDKGRLRQILINLVNNAIKFTSEGMVTIRCSDATRVIQKGLRFEVEDTGAGIESSVQEILFERFTQGDPSVSRKFGGSGLGLAICKQLVQLMNGKLGFETEINKGSLFWFEVPLVAVEDSVWTKEESHDYLENSRILIITDNSSDSSFFSSFQQQSNIDMVGLEQGKAQQEQIDDMLDSKPPEVIILDLNVKDANGDRFVKLLERQRRLLAFPMLVISSFPLRDNRLEMKLINSRASLVHKPLKIGNLNKLIAGLIKRYSAAAANEGGYSSSPGPLKDVSLPVGELQRKLHVLIAEDNPINQTLIQTMLTRLGHANQVVSNGAEALEEIKDKAYDLVLMDLQMPHMDGIAATREIRKLPGDKRNIPIIAITANATINDRERCLNAGMNEFIAKPYTAEDLEEKVARIFPA